MGPKEVLREIADRLTAKNIDFVVGGSGMLHLLGLQIEFGDWDVLTDAPASAVEECLEGLSYVKVGPKPPFASKFLFQVVISEFKVDLIGGFALEISGKRFEVPAKRQTVKEGIPLARVDSWIRVYELLGQTQKAAALRSVQFQTPEG